MVLEGTYMKFEIIDSILIATYKENMIIDRLAAEISVKERIEFTNQMCIPALVDATSVKEVNKQARDYFGSEEGSRYLNASAIYTNSLLATYLANFILMVNFQKTRIPIKLFTDKQKAIEWLKQYR